MPAGTSHEEAPETSKPPPRKAPLAIQCSSAVCAEVAAFPVYNEEGRWIQKMWCCDVCGHLFRVHEVWFESRRCADILDRKKRI